MNILNFAKMNQDIFTRWQNAVVGTINDERDSRYIPGPYAYVTLN